MPASADTTTSTNRAPEAPARRLEAEQEEVKHGALGHLSADEELQQAVCQALIADAQLDSSDIRVRAARDAVVLSGSVASRDGWRRALDIAHSQRGVSRVEADELTVRDP